MPNNIFALLIGIDQYQTMPLNGCVLDSQDVEEYLRHTIQPDRLQLQTLRDDKATKSNIIDGFLTHLGQATADDIVFVHYSGHGSREEADPVFWDFCPDYKNEIIVTVDSLTPDGQILNPLADKELRWLIHQIAQKNPHIAVMMDCCHSGGGTRNLSPNVKSRFTGNRSSRVRSIDDFAFAQSRYGGKIDTVIDQINNRFILPNGRHVQLAGCRNNQTAKELPVNGEQRGIFTYSVLDILKNTSGNISYRDLVKLATTRVVNRVSDQVPQIDSVRADDDLNTFLLGSAKRSVQYYLLRNDANIGWYIDAGSVHGIIPPTQGETVLGIIDQNADSNATDAPITMRAKITSVQPDKSTVQFIDGNPSLEGYHARLLSAPLPPLRIRLLAEKPNSSLQREAIGLVREAMNKEKLFLTEVGECDDSDYWVYAYEHEGVQKYRIIRQDADRPVVKQQETFSRETAAKVIEELVHIGRWHRIANLANPNTVFVSPNNPSIDLYEIIDGVERQVSTASGEVRLNYRYVNGQWVEPSIRVKLTNNSSRRLWCSVLDLAANFEITNELLPKQRLEPGESVFLFDGQAISPEFPEALANMGANEVRSIMKLFAATEEFDSSLFNLKGLAWATEKRNMARGSTLDQLFQRANARGTFKTPKPAVLNDWTSDQLSICIVKPVAETSEAQLKSAGIQVLPHKRNFKARVLGLSSTGQHRSRTVEGKTALALPDFLLDYDTQTYPLPLLQGRGGSDELNVLELSGIENAEEVTTKTPLHIELPIKLKRGEQIIPLALDADGLIYPIGYARNARNSETKQTVAKVSICQLPKPTGAARGEASERGILNTIKIVFQKVIADTTGLLKYEYPYLAIVTRNNKGELHYERNTERINQAVAAAQNPIVVTHGFTGETCDFFRPNRRRPDTPLYNQLNQSGYDLILAFDYDSYSTSIADTAAALKSRLVAAGFNTQKRATLLAHSMGGLVSRYAIEALDGNQLVKHLVTVGTPHQGTMWVKIANWAAMGVSLALSKLTIVGWPLTALTFLNDKMDWFKGLDKVSDDLRTNSALVQQLNGYTSPQDVRYCSVAGNVLLPQIVKGKVTQLCDKLKIPDHTQLIAKLFGESHDLVAAKSSMEGMGKTVPACIISPACDHVSYFSTEAGLNAIAEALKP